jgi:hypothetical protein
MPLAHMTGAGSYERYADSTAIPGPGGEGSYCAPLSKADNVSIHALIAQQTDMLHVSASFTTHTQIGQMKKQTTIYWFCYYTLTLRMGVFFCKIVSKNICAAG